MVEETFKIKWKTFAEEMPSPHEIIIAKTSREKIHQSNWYFVSSDKKTLYLHDMKWYTYISRCKTWLWCYAKDIEKVEEK